MRAELKSWFIFWIDLGIFTLGLLYTGLLFINPSFAHGLKSKFKELRDSYSSNLEKEEEESRGDPKLVYSELLVSTVIVVFIIGVLLLILFLGLYKKSTRLLSSWFNIHSVIVTLAVISMLVMLFRNSVLHIYQLTDSLYLIYRIITLIIVREYRKYLITERQMGPPESSSSVYRVQYLQSQHP